MAGLRTCLRNWRGKQEWTYHESVQNSFLKIGLLARQAFEKCTSSLGAACPAPISGVVHAHIANLLLFDEQRISDALIKDRCLGARDKYFLALAHAGVRDSSDFQPA